MRFQAPEEIFEYYTGRGQPVSVVGGEGSCAVYYAETPDIPDGDHSWMYFYKNAGGYRLRRSSDLQNPFDARGNVPGEGYVMLRVDHLKNTRDYYIWGIVRASTQITFTDSGGRAIEPVSKLEDPVTTPDHLFVIICVTSDDDGFVISANGAELERKRGGFWGHFD